MSQEAYIIFYNSFQSAYILTFFKPEYAWFAAHGFGHDMLVPTLLAVLAATLAMSINFALGYWLGSRKVKRFGLSDERYETIAPYFQRYVYLLLFFPILPLEVLLAVACGFFKVRPAIAFTVIALGRIVYYLYYLIMYP